MDPEPRREAMQIVDIVGQEMGPFEPQPFPDRRVDIDAAPARNLARACAIRGIDAIGNRLALAHRAPSPALWRPGRRRDGQAPPLELTTPVGTELGLARN